MEQDEQVEKVELVRIPREEQLYDREEVLGRDVNSVFPTAASTAASTASAGAKEAIGALKFVSEKELEEIKSQRGASVEDGSVSVDKPLVVVLAEAKAAKEEAFQNVWKSMKIGKNRPLDEDEAEFYDALLAARHAHDRTVQDEENRELEAFQQAVREAATAPADDLADDEQPAPAREPLKPAAAAAPAPARKPQPSAPRVKIKPVIKPKAAAALAGQPATKRLKTSAQTMGGEQPTDTVAKQLPEDDSAGLQGLLGEYQSDDE